MDDAERLRMIRCASGGGQDKTIINNIMLRFRPIAPKPVNGGPDSGISSADNKSPMGLNRRTKRKYVRVCKTNRYRRNKKVLSSTDQEKEREKERLSEKKQDKSCFDEVVALQLLPENTYATEEGGRRGGRYWCNINLDLSMANTKKIGHHDQRNIHPVMDQTAVVVSQGKEVTVESWVTVEWVTDGYTCMDGGGRGLGRTDMERWRNLEEDTCPGFVSDGLNNVKWVNGAYKRMIIGRGETSNNNDIKVLTFLVVKDKLLPYLLYCASFSCWVRVQYGSTRERVVSQMVPCDVWRMDGGGCGWRLDVEAALTLGR